MLRRNTIALGLVLALTVSVLVGLKPAQAITLIPPSLEFNGRPGETIPSKIKLFNETTSAVSLYSSAANFGAKDETGTPNFATTAPSPDDLAGWIKIAPGPFTIEPGAFTEVPFQIVLPDDAPPGGHFAGVLFSQSAPEQDGQITIAAKVGTLVLVRVAGQINEKAAIAEFSMGATTLTRPPVNFVVRVQNQGNVHLRPTGDITIRNMLGGTTAVVPVNGKQEAALPLQTRRFESSWNKTETSSVRGSFFTEVANEWKNFAFGPYTATVGLTYGQANDKTLTSVVSFWIFPWRILLVSLVVLALLIVGMIVGIRRYNRWIVTNANKGQSAPR